MYVNLDDLLAAAIGDPGSVAGRKLGPSWGRGNDSYADQEETVPRWAARAVKTALDNEGLLLPTTGRMATFRPGGDGRTSTAIIQLEGAHDIFRFMVNLLGCQIDIAHAARSVLVGLRDHMGPGRFDPMARSLLGDQHYERLRDRFERTWECTACGKGIRPGRWYAPTEDADAVCAACCKGFPDYLARLVKRPAEPVPATA
jgi:hypothetical protein